MKTWKAVEKEVARRKKGRTRAGSGNQPAYKGDVITEDALIEVKHREFRYSVTLAELHKIERESILDSGRKAAFVIHLGKKASKQSYFELELRNDPALDMIDLDLFLRANVGLISMEQGPRFVEGLRQTEKDKALKTEQVAQARRQIPAVKGFPYVLSVVGEDPAVQIFRREDAALIDFTVEAVPSPRRSIPSLLQYAEDKEFKVVPVGYNFPVKAKQIIVVWPKGRKSWALDWGALESLYTCESLYFYIPAWGKEGRYNLWEFKKLENKIGNARPKQRLTISSY